MIGGNIFSLLFGRNLDAHAQPETDTTLPAAFDATSALSSRAGVPSEATCLEGRECYMTSLQMSMAACCLAFLLSVWAAWRDQRNHSSISPVLKSPPDIVWEEDEGDE